MSRARGEQMHLAGHIGPQVQGRLKFCKVPTLMLLSWHLYVQILFHEQKENICVANFFEVFFRPQRLYVDSWHFRGPARPLNERRFSTYIKLEKTAKRDDCTKNSYI